MHVLEIEQSISALARPSLLNVIQELIVLGIAIANHFHIDLFLIANVEDYVAVLFVLFDLLVGGFAHV